jgi:glycyl-tRNA synthetase
LQKPNCDSALDHSFTLHSQSARRFTTFVQDGNDEDKIKEAKKQGFTHDMDRKGQSPDQLLSRFDHGHYRQLMAQIPSPREHQTHFTMPRDFNLMFQTSVGAMSDAASVAYFAPKRHRGISLNFKNVTTLQKKNSVRYRSDWQGLSQRNHAPQFRSREFEQMESSTLFHPVTCVACPSTVDGR